MPDTTRKAPTEHQDSRSSLVHDLRNSLFAIRTGVSLLLRTRDDAHGFAELCHSLEKESQTASDLLRRLFEEGPEG